MTLTRATLGSLRQRKTTEIPICGHNVRLQKPTPLEYSQYLTSYGKASGEVDLRLFPSALCLLTARMWIDDAGNRVFSDDELDELLAIDNDFYEALSTACQSYSKPGASSALGESAPTIVSGLPAESA